MSTSPIVSVPELAERIDDPQLRLFDVRWYLPTTGKSGRAAYDAGHLPGAQFLDLDGQLSAPAEQGPGRHPLPSPEEFAETLAEAGVSAASWVVVYDDVGGAVASRLWWMLRWVGHDDVAVLDGGYDRWVAAGLPTSTEWVRADRAPFEARPDASRVLDKAAVDALRRDPEALLIDARAAPRYQGQTEPIDARAGHIPGAVNAPFADNLEGGVLKSPEALRERFAALGADRKRTVVYCGSGVTACHDLLALEIAGLPSGQLYEGSWSDWAADDGLPCATGPEPG